MPCLRTYRLKCEKCDHAFLISQGDCICVAINVNGEEEGPKYMCPYCGHEHINPKLTEEAGIFDDLSLKHCKEGY